jgi:hypothetical protein
MAGPLAVIYNVVSDPGNNVVTSGKKTNPEIWIILIGAFGLVIGLATYGYEVCATVGTQLAKITPSRGYSAELATSRHPGPMRPRRPQLRAAGACWSRSRAGLWGGGGGGGVLLVRVGA